MNIPHKCPVCEGTGKVPFNFYNDTTGTGMMEPCRSCDGKGILWDNVSNNLPYSPLTNLPQRENNLPSKNYDPCENCPVRLSPNWSGVCHCTIPYFANPIRW